MSISLAITKVFSMLPNAWLGEQLHMDQWTNKLKNQ